MKIALVGDALSTRHLAPFADPTWEIWAAGNGYTHLKRATRYFELHGWGDIAATVKADKTVITGGAIETNFWDAPLRLGCTHVYTGREVPDKFTRRPDGSPAVAEFPFGELLGDPLFFGYFTSTFAWLIAFAITQEPDELALYGFDLSLDEYVTQKGAVEFMLGQAIRSGIKVTIAPRSMILRTPFLYALETAANRQARSILMDQRYVIDKELANRQTIMDQAFYARLGAVNRVDEHKAVCRLCVPGTPCARYEIIRADFGTAVSQEVQANIEVGQLRARLDENTYYLRHIVTGDLGPDWEKEDKGLPLPASTAMPEYEGVQHSYPLPRKIAANVRSNGTIDYEMQDGPSITEVLGIVAAKDGA